MLRTIKQLIEKVSWWKVKRQDIVMFSDWKYVYTVRISIVKEEL